MDAKLFKDLTAMAAGKTTIRKVMLAHADEDQYARFVKADKAARNKAFAAKAEYKPLDDVTTLPLVRTTILGGYGHEAAAKSACIDYMRPTVFDYQSAIFPNPKAFGVQVNIVAIAKKLPKPESELYPWSVVLNVSVTGDKRVEWFKSFEDRTRGIRL